MIVTPLMISSSYGHTDIVDLELEALIAAVAKWV